jgi:ABC-type protease/lipase transport system fused ATPase/permease subunit
MFAASILAGKALAPVEQLVAAWRGVGPAGDSWRRPARQLQASPPPDRLPMPEAEGALEVEAATVRAATAGAPGGGRPRLRPGTCTLVVGPLGRRQEHALPPPRRHGRAGPGRGPARRRAAAPLPPRGPGRALGYLPQDVGLFAGTVAENIARMAVEAEPRGIVEAARRAGAHELILRLPEGYETRLEDGGFPLSGGRKAGW